MICYRRHGHNEGDDPSYTQPILYRKIKEHPSVATLYAERLVREGVITAEEVAGHAQGRGRSACPRPTTPCSSAAERYELQELSAVAGEEIASFCPRTAVNHAGAGARDPRLTQFPGELPPASQAARLRRAAPRGASRRAAPIDWAFGEALAFGTLALEGTPVRLSGQDSGRGTFSQRHLAFLRFRNRQALHPPAAHLAGPGALRRLRQLAQRVRRAGLRIRLQRGRSADAGDLGGAVRRFRQRRADHDRPVHFLRRIRSGASPAAW